MTSITVNNRVLDVEAADDTPLLWVLRDHLSMTGTKFGCGMALCGACTVHVDGVATRSCVLPLSAVQGKSITTIEGLSKDRTHPVQAAWLELDVPQCGYCQSGQIMSAAALLKSKPNPSDAEIDAAMSGNICRCGTYPRIRKAIHRAARLQGAGLQGVPGSQGALASRAATASHEEMASRAATASREELAPPAAPGAQECAVSFGEMGLHS